MTVIVSMVKIVIILSVGGNDSNSSCDSVGDSEHDCGSDIMILLDTSKTCGTSGQNELLDLDSVFTYKLLGIRIKDTLMPPTVPMGDS